MCNCCWRGESSGLVKKKKKRFMSVDKTHSPEKRSWRIKNNQGAGALRYGILLSISKYFLRI
jgi:hypothetical protein